MFFRRQAETSLPQTDKNTSIPLKELKRDDDFEFFLVEDKNSAPGPSSSSKGVLIQNYMISFHFTNASEVGGDLFGSRARKASVEVYALNLRTMKWNEVHIHSSKIKMDPTSFSVCAYRDKMVMLGVDKEDGDPRDFIMEVVTFDFEGKIFFSTVIW